MTKHEETPRKPSEKIYKDPRHKDGWIKESELILQKQFDEYARKWWENKAYEKVVEYLKSRGNEDFFDEGTTGTVTRTD